MRTTESSWFKRWLYEGVSEIEGPHEREGRHHKHPWWKVMCLTGVDYFSTLGYQPGIAFIAAGVLSPFATFILVLLTLFGALPIYALVAKESPHGEGSIAMLEALLSRWKGKLFVLVLLGFVATDFVITITLSAADATAHILENPFVQRTLPILDHPIVVTLSLITLLGLVFMKGFKEAIGIAVLLVSVYLFLNVIVVGAALYQAFSHPELLSDWKSAIFDTKMSLGGFQIAGLVAVVSLSIISFPRLALGLSGFETGVAVMPLVQSPNRIGNTRKLLMTAALIMSVLLIGSSVATSVIVPKKEFCPSVDCGAIANEGHAIPEYCACTSFEIETGVVKEAGSANGRALAYIAHKTFGDIATVYDLSTILILWFAGASAMAGLLNIVPRYLPRYGMAPEWARAVRPLVLVFTAICFAVTVIFKADVDAQGGAYATGVLVLMSSAAVAV